MKWISNLLPQRRQGRDAADEIDAHLDEKATELMESGVPEEEARLRARREFGNVAMVKEDSRDVWIWTSMERLWQDLRLALRMMRRSPGFTAVAVASLALGIGANTAIFGLMDILLFRMLPVQNPEELRIVGVRRTSNGTPPKATLSHSYPLYASMRDQNRSFQGLSAAAGFVYRDKSVSSNNAWREGQMVSGNYFGVLGVNAILGRTITEADDAVEGVGGPQGAVAMLSYTRWRNGFNLDADVIGKQLNVNGAWLTVVGVTPPDFFGTEVGRSPDLFTPARLQPVVSPPGNWLHDTPRSSSTWVTIFGRLQPGISEAQASTDLQVIFERYAVSRMGPADKASFLKDRKPSPGSIVFEAGSRGLSFLRDRFSEPLKVLMALVGIVLLIACANLANLLLARAGARRKEIAVRLAIGAGRGRLIRQLLTESLLLALFGGGLGLLFAMWSSNLLVQMIPQRATPLVMKVTPDPRVLAFTFTLAVVTGLLFGLAPALRSTRVTVSDSLKQIRNSAGRNQRFELGKALVVAEIALSLPLIFGAGLFIGTLRNLITMDAGFTQQNVLQIRMNLDAAGYPGSQWAGVYEQLMERVTAIPGVRAASLANRGLMEEGLTGSGPVNFPGYTFHEGENRQLPEAYVGPEYFPAVGIPLRIGRLFTPKDDAGSSRVALINETLARKYFANQSPIGKRFGFGDSPLNIEIIGVVADAKYNSLRQKQLPMAYYPWRQMMPARLNSIVVRTHGDPASITRALWPVVSSMRQDLVQDIRTLSSYVDDSLVRERMLARLSGFFGFLAMLLACIGLFGVMAYSVTRRTSEIGMRVALGAMPGAVLWMVLRETLGLAVAGTAVGIPLSIGLSRFTGSFLYGMEPNDPIVLMLAALALLAVGALAGYLPARRAARVDPIVALRYE